MNRTLFVLTMLTSVFTPLTFASGVYGMNFTNLGGQPTIPELLNPDGYYYFWTAVSIYLCLAGCGSVLLWRKIFPVQDADLPPPYPRRNRLPCTPRMSVHFRHRCAPRMEDVQAA